MTEKTFLATVAIDVRVTVDDEHLNEAFMEEFRASFYQFHTLKQHVKHLAQIEARGLNNDLDEFIEGYGPIGELGIEVKTVGWSVDEVKEVA